MNQVMAVQVCQLQNGTNSRLDCSSLSTAEWDQQPTRLLLTRYIAGFVRGAIAESCELAQLRNRRDVGIFRQTEADILLSLALVYCPYGLSLR